MYITALEGHFKIYFTRCARPLTFPSKIQNQDHNRRVVTAGRPRHRWENNIKIGLENVRIHWIDLPHDWDRKLAVVNEIMTVQVSQNAENFLTS
jgi:hypothetical protein